MLRDGAVSAVVVLLSGGMDSATCLAIAAAEGHDCYALSFHYGQRHDAELDAARAVADTLGVTTHRVMPLDIGAFGGSALTDPGIAVPLQQSEAIPVTYVPARNTVFLSFALGWAEVLDADAIYVGVNAVDYSGYPDCRPEYIDAFQRMADLALKRSVEGRPVAIRVPLIAMTKAQIIARGTELGVDFASTVSCYQADALGRACGQCDACRLRRQGFADVRIADPTRYAPGAEPDGA